ncbi:hypothetical protein [Lactiplantibacillus paraxiangfangensis]|uniref:hypothetical protein n=1 Tax=Lactiplantibacillus paraxiangfangensis TaxID=3076224 RepID=UPI0030C76BC5
MAKKIKGADGQTYKMVEPTNKNRSRTMEIVFGIISLIISIISISSAFGLAAIGDAFGGGGELTMRLMLGIIISIAAFVLVFLINKNHTLISWLIIAGGILIFIVCGDYGIAGGLLFVITGIIALVRK